MAIKIQTEKPVIPIDFGKFTLEFDISDESIINFRKEAIKIQEELEHLGLSDDDDKALEQAKDVLKWGYTTFFGEGAFEKVYELSPSVIIVMNYFQQIIQGIERELNKRGFSQSQADKAKKYLAKKK